MQSAVWAGRIAAPTEKVWPYLRWDNLESMLPGGFFAGVEYEERRCIVGATRRVLLGDGRGMREKLEALSAPDLAYSYRIIDTADLPIAAYLGHVRLTAAGSSACSLVFACDFVPLCPAEEWRATYVEMQGALAGFIRTQVE
jgi:hypothetical protein